MTTNGEASLGATEALTVRRSRGFMLLAGGLGAAITALILYPLGATFAKVFLFSGKSLAATLTATIREPDLGKVLWNTAVIVGGSVALGTTIGATLAWLGERSDASMGWVTRALPLVPFLVPPIIGAIGWTILIAPKSGYLNLLIRGAAAWFGVVITTGPLSPYNWAGIIFVYTLYLVPLVYLPVAASLRNLDASLEEASTVSGASPWRTLRYVTFPAIKPGIGAGALLALIFAFSLYSVPSILGSVPRIEVLTLRIVRLMSVFPPQMAVALTLGMMMIAVIITGLWLQRRVLRRSRFATIGGRGARSTVVALGPWEWPSRIQMLGYFLVTTILPFLAIALLSMQPFWSSVVRWSNFSVRNYLGVFRGLTPVGRGARYALLNSLSLATVGATGSILVAAIIVAFTHRHWANPLARLTEASTKLPGAVSHVVIGIAFIGALAGPPFRLSGSLTILLLAYVVVTMPQASFIASTAYAQIGKDLTEASFTSGASETRTFAKISAPLMLPGLAAGWATVFVLMVGDVTISTMLASPGRPVVGYQMLDLWTFGELPTLATLATLFTVLSCVVVLSALALSGRKGRK
jgi:iron(III) transport system permease protein